MSEFFKGGRRNVAVMALVIVVVLSGFYASKIQPCSALQLRIQNLLRRGQSLVFYFPVARTTHSRIVSDPVTIAELTQRLVIRDCQLVMWKPAAGGIAVYVEPATNPNFELIVGNDFLYVTFPDGESYRCALARDAALKKALEISNLKFPQFGE